jgi:hypothetical protein
MLWLKKNEKFVKNGYWKDFVQDIVVYLKVISYNLISQETNHKHICLCTE